jgi:hypothetical protein
VFLWALSRGPVGAVTALREISVLFAVLIGMVLYREKRVSPFHRGLPDHRRGSFDRGRAMTANPAIRAFAF